MTALRGDAAPGTQKETNSAPPAPPVPAPVIPHERQRRKESSSCDLCQQKGEWGTRKARVTQTPWTQTRRKGPADKALSHVCTDGRDTLSRIH